MVSFVGRAVRAALIALSLCSPAVPVHAAEPFAAFAVASRHVGADRRYNEENPGFALGLAWNDAEPGLRVSMEAGGYLNSHAEHSPYLKITVSREVLRLADERASVRLGAFAGVAQYGGRGDAFRRMGYPAVRDWVPMLGAEVAVSAGGRGELALGFLPAPGIADVLVTAQIRVPLAGPGR